MKRIVSVISLSFLVSLPVRPDAIITGFFRESPQTSLERAQEKYKKICSVGHLGQCRLEKYTKPDNTIGIFLTYAGFLSITNKIGQFAFPRKHHAPFVYVYVTESLTPIMMMGNTVHHWKIDSNPSLTSLYRIERKENNTHEYTWEVQKIFPLTSDIIPLESLIVIANPADISITPGSSHTENTPNLTLPDFYVSAKFNNVDETLYLITISHLFGLLTTSEKHEPTKKIIQISNP